MSSTFGFSNIGSWAPISESGKAAPYIASLSVATQTGSMPSLPNRKARPAVIKSWNHREKSWGLVVRDLFRATFSGRMPRLSNASCSSSASRIRGQAISDSSWMAF